MKGQESNISIFYNSHEYFQKLEKSLADNLGLPDLRSGVQIIRDKNGWRENEKLIEYIWIVQISRSFVGWGGLFSIKFNENIFREHSNKEEVVQGIFICNQTGIGQVYCKTISETTKDIIEYFQFNLFEADKGLVLDGIGYNIRVNALNIDTFIRLNNPNTIEWEKWEQAVWTLGKELANESGNIEMINLFE